MSFSGFSQEIVGFLTDLKSNNHKAWFDTNRSRFDKLVIAPSVELVASLSGPISQMTPSLTVEPKVNGSIRRIHRDTSFSKRQSAPCHAHLLGLLDRRASQPLNRACMWRWPTIISASVPVTGPSTTPRSNATAPR